jgi:hypothetical protein
MPTIYKFQYLQSRTTIEPGPNARMNLGTKPTALQARAFQLIGVPVA